MSLGYIPSLFNSYNDKVPPSNFFGLYSIINSKFRAESQQDFGFSTDQQNSNFFNSPNGPVSLYFDQRTPEKDLLLSSKGALKSCKSQEALSSARRLDASSASHILDLSEIF